MCQFCQYNHFFVCAPGAVAADIAFVNGAVALCGHICCVELGRLQIGISSTHIVSIENETKRQNSKTKWMINEKQSFYMRRPTEIQLKLFCYSIQSYIM